QIIGANTAVNNTAPTNTLAVTSDRSGITTTTVNTNQVSLVNGAAVLQPGNPQTVTATATVTYPGRSSTDAVATTANGQFVYIADQTTDTIDVYQRPPGSNELVYVQS